MKTKQIVRAILCMLAMNGSVRAQGFMDDFSDGNAQDGSPVTWQWDASTGNCVVTPEGFKVSPSRIGQGLLAVACNRNGNELEYTGDITLRAQLRVGTAEMANGALILLQGEGIQAGYLLAINTMYFYLARIEPYYCPAEWHYVINGQFNPTQDIIIQLDVTDIVSATGERMPSRLECRMWRPGEDMPVTPQIVGYDSKPAVGRVVIAANANTDLSRSSVLFQWVEVTGTQVEPVVDFNGNGIVDIKDLTKLIECWGQNDPVVDLIPDGVVDKKDLEALMNYWQQDVNDPTLTAHWALDETEGSVACNSMDPKGGIVLGGATWRPDAGQLAGALEFDSVDDMVVAGPVVNPSKGPFSILAWVKGGAPGQVIFSQTGGVNWLMADASQGLLKTELKSAGRFGKSLCSQTTITDGDWHRVALVCDGSNRILYVDDVAAAQDVQANLTGASGNLLIGAGSTLAPGTFWFGLIDDVRIYNRTVRP